MQRLETPTYLRLFWFAFVVICAVGGYLRFQQIAIQWLTDDEWHAIHKIIESDGFMPILSSFGRSDYSIPLTLYDKLLTDTIGLTELRMRLPMLIAGCAFIILSVLWVRDRLGSVNAAVFGFLVAVSPLLVNYSRNARPYMVTLLVAAIAIWALARWTRNRDKRHLALYLLCVWLTSYLHLIMAPFVLAPLLVIAYKNLSTDHIPPIGLQQLIGISLLAVAGVATAILPPLIHDWSAMVEKTGANLPNADTLIGVWHVWLGTDSVVIVLVGLILAAIGWSRVRSAFPLEWPMWLLGLAAILAAILVMQPAWVHNPLTFGRYLLPALPLLLLLISAGICRIAQRGITSPLIALIAIALSGIFLIGTPHTRLLQRPNNFTLHSYYQFDYRKASNPVRTTFSKFKSPSPFWDRFKDDQPGRYVIAVTGQPGFESYFNLQPLYQPHHRQRLLNLQTTGVCGPPRSGEAFPSQGIFLQNAVSLTVAGDLTAKHVDWIVVDQRLEKYMRAANVAPSSGVDDDPCLGYLINRFGPPGYTSDGLQAFQVVGKPDR